MPSINLEAQEFLTHEELLRILKYDPESGIFIWRRTVNGRAFRGTVAGSPHPKLGHLSLQYCRRRYLLHRLAWLYIYGEWPKQNIDHIDGDPQNNRISNLREVNQTVNMKNARRRSNNQSGVPGVDYVQGRGWRVRIYTSKGETHVGTYRLKEDAIKARKEAERINGYSETHGRDLC